MSPFLVGLERACRAIPQLQQQRGPKDVFLPTKKGSLVYNLFLHVCQHAKIPYLGSSRTCATSALWFLVSAKSQSLPEQSHWRPGGNLYRSTLYSTKIERK